jgi:pSer/pThr/pTyr-binding forkhead associated (FHA) protein
MFKLVIQDDEGKTTVVPLIRDEITIGRKEGNTIRLTERNVSRRHARILRQNGEVQIEDLGSYNGIRVNNARIAERVSLRVSDQVQIGDYKLYLKAEGVEQVDDARTMPIERVDTARSDSGSTDVLPAVAAPAPTMPMGVATPAPGTLPPAAQLIGNPARTLVAVADTDPQGRPVASPAQVAAVLSSPVGYGKLVVLSSNFAGKEFELSRPQMIIGRTDENDIVINHRSISRNHAKLVREPDTGRYTISDLQSSNGVRVNGQDYGKVELRRGDVVDLGHVRLRFVEAGEDFIFSRDAVITDVPDTTSKKGLYLAIAAALVVVVAVVIYMAMKKGDGDKTVKGGSNDVAIADAGNLVAVAPVDALTAVDNDVDASVPTDDPKDRLKLQCAQAADAKKWADLISCAEQLRKVDKTAGDKFYTTGHEENKAEATVRELDLAIKEKQYKKANDALKAIGEESVYRKDAEARYAKLTDGKKDEITEKLKKFVSNKDCTRYDALARQEKNAGVPGEIIDAAKRDAGACVVVAVKDPPPPPKDNPCDKYDDNVEKGRDAFSGNRPADALAAYEQALKCSRADSGINRYALASACKAKRLDKARTYWKRLNQTTKDSMESLCAQNGIFRKELDQ